MWIESGITPNRNTRQRTRLAVSILLVLLLVALFSSFLVPIALAGIFSLAMEPFVSRMVKPHENRRFSSLGLLLGLFGLIMIPVLLISVSFYSELSMVASTGISKSSYYQFFTESRDRFIAWTNELLPRYSAQPSVHGDQVFDRLVEKTYEGLTTVVSKVMSALPSFLLSLFVFSVALFFFVSQSRRIKHFLLSLHLFARSDFEFMLLAMKRSSSVTLMSSVVIGVAQATLLTIACLIFHVGKPGIVFGTTFLLSFVPIVGTTPVVLTLIGMALFQHHLGVALGFLGFALVSSTLDQLIRTLWMSEVGAVHPIIAFVSLLGALNLFGISGLFFGPLIVGIAGQILPKFIREKPKPKRRENAHLHEAPRVVVSEVQGPLDEAGTPLPSDGVQKLTQGRWYN